MGLVWGIALLYFFAHPDFNGPRRLPHGRVETVAEEFGALVAPGAEIEVVASGYHWVEGPLWVPTGPRAPSPQPPVADTRLIPLSKQRIWGSAMTAPTP